MRQIKKNFNIKIKNNNRGFSLIELMVSIALIGILTSIIITTANFSETQRNLIMETNKFRSAVRLAQSYALSIPQQDNNNICGFGVYVKSDREYQIYYTYDDGSGCSANYSPMVGLDPLETFKINEKNKVQFNAIDTNVFFKSPYGDVGQKDSFVLKSIGKSSGQQTVSISSEGKID